MGHDFLCFFRGKGVVPFFLLLLFLPHALPAIPQRKPPPQNAQGMETRAALERLKYELSNHDKEIQLFDQKVENLQELMDEFRSWVAENHEQHQGLIKAHLAAHESRLDELDATEKKMLQDLKNFQTALNSSTDTILQIERKMNQLTHAHETQLANMENMQAALTTLLDALQIQPVGKETRFYEVKEGDSLGKIAQSHQTSVKALKELNGLTQDRIRKGQKLKLP